MPRPPIAFDRATGRLDGASVIERCAALALRAGSKASKPFDHRGFSIGCRLVSSMLDQRDIVLQLNDDARFAFPFGDGYWSLLLDRAYTYEVEIERFLLAVAGVDFTFIDGGANFGFWSVLASSRPFGGHPTIAIEASFANVARLTRNAELNGDRFQVLHRAIGAAPGRAWVHGHKHEALTIAGHDGGTVGEAVEVIALDSLIGDGTVAASRPLVVKLDVEGMEIDAIKGGRRLFAADTVLIVEEHGSDRNHTVSRYILGETPYSLFVLDSQSERYVRLRNLTTLDRIKVHATTGYNVFAATGPRWEERIESMPAPARH
jgi:FkbM family methyltransferase